MRDVNINSIRSIDRAVDILQSFSSEVTNLSLDELADKTGIPKSTVYRILCTLERRGLIQFDERSLTYQPGLRLMEFGMLISSVLDITKEAEDLLIDLHKKTNQTILMAIKDGDEINYIYKRENYVGLKFSSTVGERRPYIYGVLGPILLSFSSESQIERILNIPVQKYTTFTQTDTKVIYDRLKKIRKEKVFVETNETNLGVTGIGAPVFGVGSEITAAVGVVGPQVQLEDQVEQIKPLILDATKQISFRIGYRGDFFN
ncbi:IclR family transcriptional regulator [Terrihalobacillus insolitus]|uniref:IclR family transcriptional regulator n=1 Tax=Terrihalobacillus insolitus TaxID=2950438 RepID=UPI00233FAA31|nr:IclR family transcriptional regulator [Terrihalobacillus insolitus]MDC3411897.1 IclR family transcriptional regulator [Terrihalobacillus insolitus]